MQNENQVVQPTNPSVTPQPIADTNVKKWYNPYETFLLLFGCTAVFSLLTGYGTLLKIAAVVFLLFGLIAIAKGIPLRGDQSPPQLLTDANGVTHRAKRPWTPLRIVGTVLLIIILLPVVGYLALILLLIIMMSTGGVSMGT